MRTRVLLKVAALAGILALTGCAAKVAQPDQYSGFLKDYSSLKETTSASGKPELILTGRARELALEMGVEKAHVSLTHERSMAAAVVVLERA